MHRNSLPLPTPAASPGLSSPESASRLRTAGLNSKVPFDSMVVDGYAVLGSVGFVNLVKILGENSLNAGAKLTCNKTKNQ